MDFARTPVVAARRPTRQTNAEGSVWRRYQHPLTFRHKSAPTSIDFSPIAPHDFCVASSLQPLLEMPKSLPPPAQQRKSEARQTSDFANHFVPLTIAASVPLEPWQKSICGQWPQPLKLGTQIVLL